MGKRAASRGGRQGDVARTTVGRRGLEDSGAASEGRGAEAPSPVARSGEGSI